MDISVQRLVRPKFVCMSAVRAIPPILLVGTGLSLLPNFAFAHVGKLHDDSVWNVWIFTPDIVVTAILTGLIYGNGGLRLTPAFQIILRSITGDLSNKIIQKGLAFRCDRSATVGASGAPLALRDPAPPTG
jgi:hypothetical protein